MLVKMKVTIDLILFFAKKKVPNKLNLLLGVFRATDAGSRGRGPHS